MGADAPGASVTLGKAWRSADGCAASAGKVDVQPRDDGRSHRADVGHVGTETSLVRRVDARRRRERP